MLPTMATYSCGLLLLRAGRSSIDRAPLPLLSMPASDCVVRDCQGRADDLAVGRLLRVVFAPESNPLSAAAIVAEHMVGLNERKAANIQLVATAEATESILGFVEVYTPTFLLSSMGDTCE